MVSDIDKRNAVFLVYIAGYGHSGSTLLDMMLGSHTHIESMGEIKHFIQNPSIVAGNSKCACGQYARDCRYWNELTIDEGGG